MKKRNMAVAGIALVGAILVGGPGAEAFASGYQGVKGSETGCPPDGQIEVYSTMDGGTTTQEWGTISGTTYTGHNYWPDASQHVSYTGLRGVRWYVFTSAGNTVQSAGGQCA